MLLSVKDSVVAETMSAAGHCKIIGVHVCQGTRQCIVPKCKCVLNCCEFGCHNKKTCVRCPECRAREVKKATATRDKKTQNAIAEGCCSEIHRHGPDGHCEKPRMCSCKNKYPCYTFGFLPNGQVRLSCEPCTTYNTENNNINITLPRLADMAAAREQATTELNIKLTPDELECSVDTIQESDVIQDLNGTNATVYTFTTLDVLEKAKFDQAEDAGMAEALRALKRPDCRIRFRQGGRLCHITKAELNRVRAIAELLALGFLPEDLSGSSKNFALEGLFMRRLKKALNGLGHSDRPGQINKSDTARGLETEDTNGDIISGRNPTLWALIIPGGWVNAGWVFIDDNDEVRLSPDRFVNDPIVLRAPSIRCGSGHAVRPSGGAVRTRNETGQQLYARYQDGIDAYRIAARRQKLAPLTPALIGIRELAITGRVVLVCGDQIVWCRLDATKGALVRTAFHAGEPLPPLNFDLSPPSSTDIGCEHAIVAHFALGGHARPTSMASFITGAGHKGGQAAGLFATRVDDADPDDQVVICARAKDLVEDNGALVGVHASPLLKDAVRNKHLHDEACGQFAALLLKPTAILKYSVSTIGGRVVVGGYTGPPSEYTLGWKGVFDSSTRACSSGRCKLSDTQLAVFGRIGGKFLSKKASSTMTVCVSRNARNTPKARKALEQGCSISRGTFSITLAASCSNEDRALLEDDRLHRLYVAEELSSLASSAAFSSSSSSSSPSTSSSVSSRPLSSSSRASKQKLVTALASTPSAATSASYSMSAPSAPADGDDDDDFETPRSNSSVLCLLLIIFQTPLSPRSVFCFELCISHRIQQFCFSQISPWIIVVIASFVRLARTNLDGCLCSCDRCGARNGIIGR